jgi:hypothetical protein
MDSKRISSKRDVVTQVNLIRDDRDVEMIRFIRLTEWAVPESAPRPGQKSHIEWLSELELEQLRTRSVRGLLVTDRRTKEVALFAETKKDGFTPVVIIRRRAE